MQDEKAFIDLLAKHQQIVFKVCRMYMDTPEDRSDLFQEIALQAWKSFGNFKGAALFSTWLYRVAINTALTFFKKGKRTANVELRVTLPEIAEEKSTIEEQMQAMYKAIGMLSHIDKALVMLYLEDYNYQDIGQMLGITANNVAVKMNRIKLKLKEQSQQYYQG